MPERADLAPLNGFHTPTKGGHPLAVEEFGSVSDPQTATPQGPPPQTQVDFFISYAGVDRVWAESIAWWLEESGYKVFIQAWDFRPGHRFIGMMQRGTEFARHTVPVLSLAYFEALNTQPEWTAAVADDPSGIKRKVIPVRIQDFQPKGMFRDIIYIDLVPFLQTGDKMGAKSVLLEGVREGRCKPAQEPPFPKPKA